MDSFEPTTLATKTLLLMRHAKSSWDQQDLDDIDRPLNTRGKTAAKTMAPFVAAWHPQWIGCSIAARTRATLAPIVQSIEVPVNIDILASLYDSNEAAYLRVLRALPTSVQRAMIIGHNPILVDLTHLLTGSAHAQALDRISTKFPTGTVVALQCSIARWSDLAPHCAELVDTVRPRDVLPTMA